jgi:hypothetical protein
LAPSPRQILKFARPPGAGAGTAAAFDDVPIVVPLGLVADVLVAITSSPR